MKKMAFAAVLGAAALAMSACGGGGAAKSAGGSGDGDLVAVIAKGYASPFWAAVKAGAEDAGKQAGVKVDFRGPDTETDVNKQVDQMNQMLAQNPKALVFAALDSKAQAGDLQKWADKKIPVIAFDSGVTGSDIPITTVSTDNKAAAAEAAKHIAEKLGKKGKVALICHSQTSQTGIDRRDGFKEWIEKNAPEIKIADIQYNDSDQNKAQQQADTILTANPDLNAFFATDDDGAVAAANVVKQKGKTGKVLVAGFDSGKDQMDKIKSGEIFGSVTQNPYKIGFEAVKAAVEVIKGKKKPADFEKFTDSGFYWYNKDNMNDPDIKKALYD